MLCIKRINNQECSLIFFLIELCERPCQVDAAKNNDSECILNLNCIRINWRFYLRCVTTGIDLKWYLLVYNLQELNYTCFSYWGNSFYKNLFLFCFHFIFILLSLLFYLHKCPVWRVTCFGKVDLTKLFPLINKIRVNRRSRPLLSLYLFMLSFK